MTLHPLYTAYTAARHYYFHLFYLTIPYRTTLFTGLYTGNDGNLFEWRETGRGEGELTFLGTENVGSYSATIIVADCWSDVEFMASVEVKPKRPPVARNDVGYSMVAGTSKEFAAPLLIANDVPGEPNHGLTVTGCDMLSAGHVGSCNPGGSFTFAPTKCFVGTATFNYEVRLFIKNCFYFS